MSLVPARWRRRKDGDDRATRGKIFVAMAPDDILAVDDRSGGANRNRADRDGKGGNRNTRGHANAAQQTQVLRKVADEVEKCDVEVQTSKNAEKMIVSPAT